MIVLAGFTSRMRAMVTGKMITGAAAPLPAAEERA
jgi:hypothetical protein